MQTDTSQLLSTGSVACANVCSTALSTFVLHRGLAQQAKDLAALPTALVGVSGVRLIAALKRPKCEFEMHPEKRRQFDELSKCSHGKLPQVA